MPERVSLRPVERDNVRAICELQLAEGQDRYVAPAAFTVAEAAFEPQGWLRAIYLGEDPVGVLFVERLDPRRPRLVRFMIDARHQRRRIGREAMRLLTEHLARVGGIELSTSYQPGPHEPAGFYHLCGFRETGRVAHRERVVTLSLSSSDAG
jgi:diamine N-acetyltransferase